MIYISGFILEAIPGTTIDAAIDDAIKFASANHKDKLCLVFNGIEIPITKESIAQERIKYFWNKGANTSKATPPRSD